ncbi:acetoacetyl-CoA synthetase [Allopseudospirillum japonicum]|uniref:Acetoacetyl-CoA synthetase n=1 Tax=Allopseudospirillum japonicum TaxID=64971 RepID=A0A1H6SQ43_9GAMM|nr:acetoacetate--CoA ligase [Allopseudospirillum japonicum]SEI66917.1 acetoacetyl-CoA synthetase [Allopseudospirillum japonicum]
MNAPLWQASEHYIRNTHMYQFMQAVNQAYEVELQDYSDLYQWSLENTAEFWEMVWEYGDIRAADVGSQVLINEAQMPGATWFPEARLNFAENLLRYRDDQLALVFRGEKGQRETYTYAQLYKVVAEVAAGLQRAGVKAGDRVAGFVPNSPYAVIAMLASASLGAIWSSCSPDFGINGVMDRFGQIQPKVLFATDGYFYSGKTLDSLPKIAEILQRIPSIETAVILPFVQEQPNIESIARAQLWQDFKDPQAQEIEFQELGFAHPLYIMYSSGTTGVPKCIVHSAGGTLLQHVKEHMLHTNLHRDDTLFYYTTCGWMMWNWLVSGLAVGATLVLYDGSPFYPQPSSLWQIAEEEKISIFGTSAKYIAACEKAGVTPQASFDLTALKAVLSTGSPLAHESFDYVYEQIGKDILLASISGGTDIVSCFALGCPIRPVYRGQLQCRGLGMAVEIYNDQGESVREQKGELVCVKPFPSMPIGFWNDENGEKYQAAYFADYANVWAHGDYAEITAEDGIIIHGRSDAVLNPGGVRIGTAEIYRQVEKVPSVLESLCIGQDWQDDVRVILFVRMQPGYQLDDEIRKQIKETIRANTTPRHVPAKIIEVADIPRTISGKIVELAVRNVVHGRPVKNVDALANPEALSLFENLAELQS